VFTPLLFSFAYLLCGMGTTTAMWTHMEDELEMALRMDLDDEDDLPAFRMLLSVFFVLAWPLVLVETFSKRP
jgi:hypothetical protein